MDKEELYSKKVEMFGTSFLLAESEEEKPVKVKFGGKKFEYQAQHIIKWDTGRSFCGAVSDNQDDLENGEEVHPATKLIGTDNINIVFVCNECADKFKEQIQE